MHKNLIFYQNMVRLSTLFQRETNIYIISYFINIEIYLQNFEVIFLFATVSTLKKFTKSFKKYFSNNC